MSTPDKYLEMRMKHLELIQGVINRMSGYSATLKNYCITLVVAVVGFAFTVKQGNLVALSALAVMAFAYLDARYLQLERAYRSLFEDTRLQDWDARPLFDLRPGNINNHPYWQAVVSWSVLAFYGPVLAVVLLLYCFTMGMA
jgi:hypothetical protein